MGKLSGGLQRAVEKAVEAIKASGGQPSSVAVEGYLRQKYNNYRRMKAPVLERAVARLLRTMSQEATVQPPPAKRQRTAGPDGGQGTSGGVDTPSPAPLVGNGGAPAAGAGVGAGAGANATAGAEARTAASGRAAPSSLNRSLYSSRRSKGARRSQKANGAVDSGAQVAPSSTITLTPPTQRFSDMGGVQSCIKDIVELVEYPLSHPEIFHFLGVDPPRGVLLHGPSGCGKTLLGRAIAGELGVPFQYVSAPELVGSVSGESEKKVRAVFDAAVAAAPSIIFLDEVDVIAPKRESSQRSMDKRIVAQLLTCWDKLALDERKPSVIVLGATSRPDTIDKALRRPGRFDREIQLPIPDEDARSDILKVMTREMRVADDVDFAVLARATPGYVGADLAAVAKEAAVFAVHRALEELLKRDATGMQASSTPSFEKTLGKLRSIDTMTVEEMEGLSLELRKEDFESAVKKVQPSATREGFGIIPDVSWEDVGALKDIREELKLAVVEPIRHPERYARLGIKVPAGLLLYGPPGCGKTLLAKAVANESRANFISIKGPELLDKYVGESERAVRQTFQKARASAPCIVFFDELDALAPKRGSNSGAGGVSERVVNQLLTELDGLDSRGNVFVIAATNRPDIIDSAMLRPGRLDKLLYVALPSPHARVDILKTLVRTTPLGASCTEEALSALARDRCDRFSGADMAGLVREAALCTLRSDSSNGQASEAASVDRLEVGLEHFEMALSRITPSVTREDELRYNLLQGELRHARSSLSTPRPRKAKPRAPSAPAPVAPVT